MAVRNLSKVIETLNALVDSGEMAQYAIGGAVSTLFYVTPRATNDLDIFTQFSVTGTLLSMRPFVEAMQSKGATMEGEHLVLYGCQVQILPPSSPLVEAAIKNSAIRQLGTVRVPVFAPEYICAIALQVGRYIDLQRVQDFLDAQAVPLGRLKELVLEYKLQAHANKFPKIAELLAQPDSPSAPD